MKIEGILTDSIVIIKNFGSSLFARHFLKFQVRHQKSQYEYEGPYSFGLKTLNLLDLFIIFCRLSEFVLPCYNLPNV